MSETDRRRGPRTPQSPIETLQQLPALVVLERFPVPVLAIGKDGEILFANSAFGDMVGHPAATVQALGFHRIFRTMPAEESALTVLQAHADLIVELVHSDGSTVRASMSKSALLRGDDQFALAVFQDLTEQLWVDEV
jgi:PAS domain S-box-containing protein